VGCPRTDLKVTLDGLAIKPGLALGSWLAMQPMSDTEAMVMGDLVLTAYEVNSVMKALVDNGIEVTALHKHLLRGGADDDVHAHRRTGGCRHGTAGINGAPPSQSAHDAEGGKAATTGDFVLTADEVNPVMRAL